jgi:hypothetical protein
MTSEQVNTVSESENQILQKGTRSFKVKLENNGPLYGRYNGDSPYQAANKALSEIIRNRVKNNQNSDEEITFFLVETTKGSGKKTHQYTGKRTKLDVPVEYTVGETVVKKEFKNILRKVKKSGQKGGAQQNTQNVPVIVSAQNTGDVSTVTIDTNVQTL